MPWGKEKDGNFSASGAPSLSDFQVPFLRVPRASEGPETHWDLQHQGDGVTRV